MRSAFEGFQSDLKKNVRDTLQTRFQQRRCTGEMLLDLTESDLINDFGIANRIHRDRILSAIDAIKTSDEFSDDDDDDDDDEDEDEEDESGGNERSVEGDEEDDDSLAESDVVATAQRAARASLGEGINSLVVWCLANSQRLTALCPQFRSCIHATCCGGTRCRHHNEVIRHRRCHPQAPW